MTSRFPEITLFFHTQVLRCQLTNLTCQGRQLQVISGFELLSITLAVSVSNGGTPGRLGRTEPLTKMATSQSTFSQDGSEWELPGS